jgi:hypothetical protein
VEVQQGLSPPQNSHSDFRWKSYETPAAPSPGHGGMRKDQFMTYYDGVVDVANLLNAFPANSNADVLNARSFFHDTNYPRWPYMGNYLEHSLFKTDALLSMHLLESHSDVYSNVTKTGFRVNHKDANWDDRQFFERSYDTLQLADWKLLQRNTRFNFNPLNSRVDGGYARRNARAKPYVAALGGDPFVRSANSFSPEVEPSPDELAEEAAYHRIHTDRAGTYAVYNMTLPPTSAPVLDYANVFERH